MRRWLSRREHERASLSITCEKKELTAEDTEVFAEERGGEQSSAFLSELSL